MLVLCATQAWGVVEDRAGNKRRNISVSFDVPLYADQAGTIELVGAVTDAFGRIPGYVESGSRMVTIGTQPPVSVEALSSALIGDAEDLVNSALASVGMSVDTVNASIASVNDSMDTLSGSVASLDTYVAALDSRIPFFSAADPQYGIVADGTTDNTAALATFYASIPAGSIAFFPAGTYVGLHAPGRSITILGEGKHKTEFRPPTTVAALTKWVDFSNKDRCSLIGVKLNANGNANISRGVSNEGNGWDKHLLVLDCWFENFTATTAQSPHGGGAAAIYVWTANAVTVENSDFIDCVYPIYMDTPASDCIVVRNRIRNPNLLITKGAITLKRTSSAECGALVGENDIYGVMNDPSGIGVEGHGINLIQCRGVRLPQNRVKMCATAGVHLGSGSWGFDLEGGEYTLCALVNGGAIYAEIGFSTIGVGAAVATTTSGAITLPAATIPLASTANAATEGVAVVGGQRVFYTGVSGNSLTGCSGGTGTIASGAAVTLAPFRGEGGRIRGPRITAARVYGIAISYAPNVTIAEPIIHRCGREAIISDSDRTKVVGGTLTDNYAMRETPNPGSNPNVKAQVRLYGIRGKVSGTDIIDRLGGPDYAVAVNDSHHVVDLNDVTTGGALGGVYEPGGATTNTIGTNVNA